MRPARREWLYEGAAHEPGVLSASRQRRERLPEGSTLLIAGDDHARQLTVPLRALCDGRGVSLAAVTKPGATVESWAVSPPGKTSQVRPTVTLVSLCPSEPADPRRLRQLATAYRANGSAVAWVRPPSQDDALRRALASARVPSFHSEALRLERGPDGTPTASGYAGWAGAIWRWIG